MKLIFSSLQWALFILTSSVVIPVAIAADYGLDAYETIEFVQRTLFALGLAGILQSLFGHRLPVQEGPAGLWWGVFTLYAGLGTVLFGSHLETLRVLQYAFLLSGVIFILLSVFGLVEKLARLFTPTVTGIYLILMVIQLSSSFVQGMFGLEGSDDTVKPGILALSFIIIIAAYGFMKIPKIGQYSVLFSIVFGWLLFAIFGLAEPVTKVRSLFSLPKIFAFGAPRVEPNMIIMVLFITLLLLANLLATVRVVQQVLEDHNEKPEKNRYKQTGIISGVNQLLGGLFSAIGPVPVSGSAGFMNTTGITKKLPFIIGSLVIVAISLFPPFTAFVSAIPKAVGYAAIFPIFASIIGIALKEFEAAENKQTVFQVAGISLFAGVGSMFIPSEAFSAMPPTLVSILSNGLVFGAIVAVVTEAVVTKKNKKTPQAKGSA